jgi:hypothetical protein
VSGTRFKAKIFQTLAPAGLCVLVPLLAKGATMLNDLLNALFGCPHRKTSFPLTPRRKLGNNVGRTETYVVCLDCGTEFAYDWQEMRIRKSINDAHSGHLIASPFN